MLLGYALLCVGLIATIAVIVGAFRASFWKGIIAIICPLYWFYFAFAEYKHKYKWPIIFTAIIGGMACDVLFHQSVPTLLFFYHANG